MAIPGAGPWTCAVLWDALVCRLQAEGRQHLVPAGYPQRSEQCHPQGPRVTAQSLAGAVRFPGLVIIVSFLPRNAAPGPGPDTALSLADVAEPPAPRCQAMETQVSLEREPTTFNTSQASPSLQGHAVGLTSWHRGQRLYPGRNEEHNVLEGDSRIIYCTKIKGGMQKGIGRFKAAPMAQHHVDVSCSLFHGVNLELGRGTTAFWLSAGGNYRGSSAHGLYNLP